MLPRPPLPSSHFSPTRPFIPSSSATPSPFQHPTTDNLAFYPPQHHQGPLAFEHPSGYHPNVPFMDPADSRTFFSYTPNEVKHRRRTTSSQLKVLESVFKRDTKPNAALRGQLAAQLDMTARGVQIWFQNRRAKEKLKVAKLAAASRGLDAPFPSNDSPPSAVVTNTPSPSERQEPSTDASADSQPSPNEQPASEDKDEAQTPSTEELSALPVPSPPRLQVVTNLPTQNSRSPIGFQQAQAHSTFPQPDPGIFARRGSLPANMFHPPGVYPNTPRLGDPFDPALRRQSIDLSLHRLPNNPYASHARFKNGMLYGARLANQSRMARPPVTRSGTLYNVDMRRGSLDSRSMLYPPTSFSQVSPFTPELPSRGAVVNQQAPYIVSRRPRGPILAGPLPTPNYTFGEASKVNSPSSADSERNSPDSLSFRGEDTEDDDNSARYSASSRFGSIASVTTSESSLYFPSPTACEHDPNIDIYASRRGSSASVMGLMSQLHVSNSANQIAPHEVPSCNHFLPHNSSTNTDNTPVETSDLSPVEAATGVYGPQQPPVIQDGISHSHAMVSSVTPAVPISATSELTYALQPEKERNHGNLYASPAAQESIDTQTTNQQPTAYYLQPQGHVTVLEMNANPPTFGYPDKYSFDAECSPLSTSGQYSNYTSLDEGFAVGSHSASTLQHPQMLHTIPNQYSVYAQVDTNESAAPSLSHEVPNVDTYVNYT
uniref:Putative homeodomain protein n=1 Tax=Volvariella volvacea TaxID=36659 RepID=A0A2H4Z451_9AGAR|nr:putative homeodomain protein [Volvariella volvacea]